MGVIFISHSSKDNAQALRVRDWLREQGWRETFLDLDPMHGLAPGQRWQEELKRAGERCAAVVVLVSPNWAGSKWCLTEFLLASQLGKRIFPVIIAPTPFQDLPIELTAHFQLADISEPAKEADGFERLRIGIKRAGLDPRDFTWPPPGQPERSPYRGLRTLEEEDAAIFFGREAAITKGLDALRRMRDGIPERMLVVLGASGAGKSSFLRAGLMSRLRRDNENFLLLPVFRPERAALTGPSGLQRALGVAADASDDAIVSRLQELRSPVIANFQRLASVANESWSGRAPTLVLPIDQGEELFAAENTEASSAASLLARVVALDPDLVVILTIRSDSFEQLQADPALAGIARQPFDLPRLSHGAFKEVIEGPGRLAIPPIHVEPELTEQLVRDLNAIDALPLLAFTLERMVTEFGGGGRLELQAYRRGLGGLSGAIARAVDEAFIAAMADPDLPDDRIELENLARQAFIPWLARVDQDSTPKRRTALMSELPPGAHTLIQKFIEQRLLVSDVAAGGAVTVEVSHEAVLRNWSLLSAWIAAERQALSRAEGVMRAAADWSSRTGAYGALFLVHRGERLAAAQALLQRPDMAAFVGAAGHKYLEACADREQAEANRERLARRARGFLQTAIVVLLVAAVGITAVGGWLVIDGQRNLGRAKSLMLARAAEQALASGDALRALHLSAVASRDEFLTPSTSDARAQLASAAQSLNQLMQIEHPGVIGATFSSDERQILSWSRDGTVRLWNATTGIQVGHTFSFYVHDNRISDPVFVKNDSLVLTWNEDSTASLWNVATGLKDSLILDYGGNIKGAVLSNDRNSILTFNEDETTHLWETATGREIPTSGLPKYAPGGAVFSEDDRHVLIYGGGRTAAELWDLSTGKQVGPDFIHDDEIRGATISSDGTLALGWIWFDTTAQLWDAATGKRFGPPLAHNDYVDGAVFSDDNRRLLTWVPQRRDTPTDALLWDVATGKQIGTTLQHEYDFDKAEFSRDGTRLLTKDSSAVYLWNAETGEKIETALSIEGEANFSDRGDRIITWDSNRIQLWDSAGGEQIGQGLFHDGGIYGASFSKDANRILSWSEDGTVRLWAAATNKQFGDAFTHEGLLVEVATSNDGRRLLTWNADGTARLWDVETQKQIIPDLFHEDRVLGAIFSRDESRIATWGGEPIPSSRSAELRLWSAATGQRLGPTLKHNGGISGAMFSADESRILTSSYDGSARQWDATTGQQIGAPMLHDGEVYAAEYSLYEDRILTLSSTEQLSSGREARLWDAATGRQIGTPISGRSLRAELSKDGTRFLTWDGDGDANLWDAITGKPVGNAFSQDGPVYRAWFSKDTRRIYTWSFDATLRVWDIGSGQQVGSARSFEGAGAHAVLSDDETRILAWGEDEAGAWSARVWDMANGAPLGPAFILDGQFQEYLDAAFSQDKARVLITIEDIARVWDGVTGKQVGPALAHGSEITQTIFLLNDSRVLTSGGDNVRLWEVEWATDPASNSTIVGAVCAAKLNGARTLDRRAIELAPVLRDREGEDVCAWSPPWYDGLLRALLGWAFP